MRDTELGVMPVLAIGGGVAAAEYALFPCARYIQAPILRRRMRRDRTLTLTYDDGPGKTLTPRVLDTLAAFKARAVFFLLGRRVSAALEIVERTISEGHQIGWHSQQHFHPWKTLPFRALVDSEAGFRTIRPHLPARPFFRPPYGKMTLSTWLAVRRRGARVLWWTIDSEDTYPNLPEPQKIAARMAREGGGVVLMHDFDRSPDRAKYVLETTELLLKTAEREGIRCSVPFGTHVEDKAFVGNTSGQRSV